MIESLFSSLKTNLKSVCIDYFCKRHTVLLYLEPGQVNGRSFIYFSLLFLSEIRVMSLTYFKPVNQPYSFAAPLGSWNTCTMQVPYTKTCTATIVPAGRDFSPPRPPTNGCTTAPTSSNYSSPHPLRSSSHFPLGCTDPPNPVRRSDVFPGFFFFLFLPPTITTTQVDFFGPCPMKLSLCELR